jgi:uncharacterized protein
MREATSRSDVLSDLLASHRDEIDAVLERYSATRPRIFGSVARGEANASSDIDLIVDLVGEHGNPLMRIAGIGEELTRLLGVRVDVVSQSLLRDEVSRTALADAVAM